MQLTSAERVVMPEAAASKARTRERPITPQTFTHNSPTTKGTHVRVLCIQPTCSLLHLHSMDTTTRRRFDVEFCDETSGEPLIRLERVPFDISQTVQSLRAELELRSGWTDFGLLVRQGLDGPTINLSERDTLDDAVAADESTLSSQVYLVQSR